MLEPSNAFILCKVLVFTNKTKNHQETLYGTSIIHFPLYAPTSQPVTLQTLFYALYTLYVAIRHRIYRTKLKQPVPSV